MQVKTFLDAANIVLEEAEHPMSVHDIISQVLSRNLWARKGRPETAYNSLYGTLIKTVKAGDSRFGRIGKSNKFYSLHVSISLSPVLIPEEILAKELYHEGVSISIKVNRYERNQKAREKCIQHYGAKCFVCGFSFGEFYGEIGEQYIHVHHIVSLSEIKGSYKVDPVNDLRPVCPNCHAMLHVKNPAFTISELKKKIAQHGAAQRRPLGFTCEGATHPYR